MSDPGHTGLPIALPSADERAFALLAEEGLGDLFHLRQHHACCLVDRYAAALAVAIAIRLDLPRQLEMPRPLDHLIEACHFVPTFAPALHWLLEMLVQEGAVQRGADGYLCCATLRVPDVDAIRTAGLAVDPSYEPAYALLDEAAALYPRVAWGEVTAERALFLRVRLWQAYFSNANGYYALGNYVAARAAAQRLVEAGGGPVLEVGAGLGSASEALFETLASTQALGLVERYVLTEPVPFFRRRAEAAIRERWPQLPVHAAPLDIDNAPWASSTPTRGEAYALVWGVNVFHLARDLDAALATARQALRPGGWLVVGEGFRPRPLEAVAAELPFRLLPGYADVVLDTQRRPTPGFLTAAAWQAALERTGFEGVRLLPAVERLQRHYDGFLAGAACGRRPAA